MSEPYPLPAYAASIWIAGDQLMLALPPADGFESRTHCVAIPLERLEVQKNTFGEPVPGNRGLAVLLTVLHQRDRARRSPRIGEPGAQARHAIAQAVESSEKYKAWREAMSASKAEAAAKAAEAEAFLKELGVEL